MLCKVLSVDTVLWGVSDKLQEQMLNVVWHEISSRRIFNPLIRCTQVLGNYILDGGAQ
jgi:hypothetical protein